MSSHVLPLSEGAEFPDQFSSDYFLKLVGHGGIRIEDGLLVPPAMSSSFELKSLKEGTPVSHLRKAKATVGRVRDDPEHSMYGIHAYIDPFSTTPTVHIL